MSYFGQVYAIGQINITFEDGVYESEEVGPLGPHMGYYWIRLDPLNATGWTQKPFTGSNRF